MNLGISTYTYTWSFGVPGYPEPETPMTLVDLLYLAHARDINVVQLCDNVPLHSKSDTELADLSALAKQLGLEIEVGTRGVSRVQLLEYLHIADIFDAKLVRTVLIEGGQRTNIAIARGEIAQVSPVYAAAGVKLSIENHEKHRCSELRQLIEDLDSDVAGICLDTVNSFGALECPRQVIETLAPYTNNLHVKDFKIRRLPHQMGFEVTGAPAGEGDLDINFAINAIKSHNPDANAILELWTPFTQTITDTLDLQQKWAETSYTNLKEILQ